MAIVEEMHSLVEGITRAGEARRSGLMLLRHLVAAEQGERRKHVQSMRSERQEATRQQRAALSSVRSERQEATRQQRAALSSVRSELAQAEAQRGSRVQDWLREVSDARRAVRIEWRHLAAPSRERAGTSKAGEETEEFSSVRDRVFGGLADHPDGLRLTEIEREFGMSRFESNRVVKSLMDNGKVGKRGLLYFAI